MPASHDRAEAPRAGIIGCPLRETPKDERGGNGKEQGKSPRSSIGQVCVDPLADIKKKNQVPPRCIKLHAGKYWSEADNQWNSPSAPISDGLGRLPAIAAGRAKARRLEMASAVGQADDPVRSRNKHDQNAIARIATGQICRSVGGDRKKRIAA